jgi:hypothetical protein
MAHIRFTTSPSPTDEFTANMPRQTLPFESLPSADMRRRLSSVVHQKPHVALITAFASLTVGVQSTTNVASSTKQNK